MIWEKRNRNICDNDRDERMFRMAFILFMGEFISTGYRVNIHKQNVCYQQPYTNMHILKLDYQQINLNITLFVICLKLLHKR